MTSTTEIANNALRHLAVATEISNLDTDQSKQAKACRAFYDKARRKLLRVHEWRFCKSIEGLVLIEESPNSQYDYSYQYPSDCLFLRRISNDSRIETEDTKIPFEPAMSAGAKVVWTDKEDAEAEYTVDVANPNLYHDDFILALGALLAVMIAPSLTGGDAFKLGERAAKIYTAFLAEAIAADMNEALSDEPPLSSIERAR